MHRDWHSVAWFNLWSFIMCNYHSQFFRTLFGTSFSQFNGMVKPQVILSTTMCSCLAVIFCAVRSGWSYVGNYLDCFPLCHSAGLSACLVDILDVFHDKCVSYNPIIRYRITHIFVAIFESFSVLSRTPLGTLVFSFAIDPAVLMHHLCGAFTCLLDFHHTIGEIIMLDLGKCSLGPLGVSLSSLLMVCLPPHHLTLCKNHCSLSLLVDWNRGSLPAASLPNW